jgi:hypothetical protein|tara:strand:- start:308 stop:700 length:393 start_codon:yes stop_codon:yes gene_type:complete
MPTPQNQGQPQTLTVLTKGPAADRTTYASTVCHCRIRKKADQENVFGKPCIQAATLPVALIWPANSPGARGGPLGTAPCSEQSLAKCHPSSPNFHREYPYNSPRATSMSMNWGSTTDALRTAFGMATFLA